MATLFELKEHLKDGGKICRPCWEKRTFIKLKDGVFCQTVKRRKGYFVPKEELLLDDWEVYEEPEKKKFEITHTGLYKTRDGRKVFVSSIDKSDILYAICGVIEEGCTIKTWSRRGRFTINEENPEDIVAEWED